MLFRNSKQEYTARQKKFRQAAIRRIPAISQVRKRFPVSPIPAWPHQRQIRGDARRQAIRGNSPE